MSQKIFTHLNSFTTKKSTLERAQANGAGSGIRNDLILRAAMGEADLHRAPVWIMRQAGRYLPEFCKIRRDHEFFEVCRNPELASEITMQPIRRFSGLLDAAIIFSDILVVPQAMGLQVEMHPQKGPLFPEPLKGPSDLSRLSKKIDVTKELGYVYDAIRLTIEKLDGEVPLIGFCGAPWTLMAYMVEGGGSKDFTKAKRWLVDYPEESRELLQKITDVCIDFLVGQVKAGAQLLQVFDSLAGDLSPYLFETFSLPYLRLISSGVKDALATGSTPSVPMIVFAKGAMGHSLEPIAKAGYDVVALDWTVRPSDARKIVDGVTQGNSAYKPGSGAAETGHRIALQGNMDPSILFASKEGIDRAVERMMRSKLGGFGGSGAYICNLGHGITPGVDPENLRHFLKAVHKFSREVSEAKDEE